MRLIAALVIAFASFGALAADTPPAVTIPEGFVAQKLVETDGLIARPKDWFFTSTAQPAGWLWTISKEDASRGPYETGLRIQMLVGVEKNSSFTRQQIVEANLRRFRENATVVSECEPTRMDKFMRQCLEVVENAPRPPHPKRFRVQYSAFWGVEMDVVVFTIFGAPEDEWEANRHIAETMGNFQMFGPNFGKESEAPGQ